MSIKLKNIDYLDRTLLGLGNLNDVCLEINDGEFVGVLGTADSGSSALGAVISGFVIPLCGKLSIDDKEVESFGHGGRIGYVPEFAYKYFSEKTVGREIGVAPDALSFGEEAKREAINRAAELVGLSPDKLEKHPAALPDADRRCVAIAAALAVFPDILVLDNPTSGMEAWQSHSIFEALKKLNSQGMTVIVISNDADELAECAERVIIMEKGCIARMGKAKAVFSEYYDLIHLGVSAPKARECSGLLRRNGVDMPDNVVQYNQFLDRLRIIMWRKKQ